MNYSRLPRRIAVLGAAGQLGSELCRQLGERAVAIGRCELDLLALESITDAVCNLRPGAVINAAAYTKVDHAESEPDICRRTNATAVRQIAEACTRLGCPLVQVSTDYVFGQNEARRVPYREEDVPGPINVYGQTKLEGEEFAAAHSRHFIVRTCGLYTTPAPDSPHQNFVASLLRLARDCSSIRVVNDQRCTPSYVPHVARAILHLLSTKAYGTYHVTQRGSTTWYDFAVEFSRTVSLPAEVEPISSAEYPSAACRPRYSLLDCGKYASLAGSQLPPWEDALQECLS